MPSVEFSTRDFLDCLGSDYSVAELEGAIPMIGVGLDFIDGERIVLEVFPNRPDMLCVEGFARAFRGFMGVDRGLRAYGVGDSGITFFVEHSVEKVRPFVSCGVVLGVSMDDATVKSIMDIQEKLHLTHGRNRRKVAIGVHDLDKVKPPFTYKAVSPESVSFVPLDSSERMNLREILERHPKGMAFAHVLDGLLLYPVIVDRDSAVLSFPPIINGELSRLTGGTRNLFVEVTGWSQLAVDQAVNIITSSMADRGGRVMSVELKKK